MPPRGGEGPSAIGVPVVHAERSVGDVEGTEVPAGVEFLETLPRNATGKILKEELRNMVR